MLFSRSLLIAGLALLLAPAGAFAEVTVTSPAANAPVTVTKNDEWSIKLSTTCPAGMACGAAGAGSRFTPNYFMVNLAHEQAPKDSRGFYETRLNGFSSAQSIFGFPLGTSSHTVDIASYQHVGRWYVRGTWFACPLGTTPDPMTGSPCTTTPIEHPFTVLPITTKPAFLLYGRQAKPSQAGVTIQIQGLNFARTKLRAKVVLQKQVKKGKKRVWVAVATKKNVRLGTSLQSVNGAMATPTFSLPKSLTASTRMRAQLTLTTVGVKPKMKTIKLASKIKTRGQLRKDSTSGGGVSIGG